MYRIQLKKSKNIWKPATVFAVFSLLSVAAGPRDTMQHARENGSNINSLRERSG
jgi:hypothetical protein